MHNPNNLKIEYSRSAINESQWNDLLEKSSRPSVFQSPGMYELLESVSGIKPFILSVLNNETLCSLAMGMIQESKTRIGGFFSRRAIIYGPPIYLHNTTGHCALRLLVKEISVYLKKQNVIYVESRNLFNCSDLTDSFRSAGWEIHPHYNIHVNLVDINTCKKRISKSKNRQIKKSKKNGATVSPATSLKDMNEFYNILKSLYKTKIRTPLPDYDFFKKAYYHPDIIYLIVKLNDKVIGGIMCPKLKGKIIYEWYICGLDKQYEGIYPSVLATWGAIEYGYNNGYKLFDFMGAGAPNREYGVREFKMKFGGEVIESDRFRKIIRPGLFRLGSFAISLLKNTKR